MDEDRGLPDQKTRADPAAAPPGGRLNLLLESGSDNQRGACQQRERVHAGARINLRSRLRLSEG